MRKTLGTATLMLAFCYPTLAGEIPNPPAPQPTPARATQAPTNEPTFNGDTQNDISKSLTQIALELLAVLPSLL